MHLTSHLNQRYIELEFSEQSRCDRPTHPSTTFVDYSKQLHRLSIHEVLLNVPLIHASGQATNLQDYTTGKPVILLIHQGQTSALDSINVQAWERALPILSELGITVLEIVPSLQERLFSARVDSAGELELLMDQTCHLMKSLMLLNSPTIAQCSSYQNTHDQIVCLSPHPVTPMPEQITCIVTANHAFLSYQAVDPMYHLMTLDPDYWLALV